MELGPTAGNGAQPPTRWTCSQSNGIAEDGILGNVGDGSPSVDNGPILWAKYNATGFPCIRWTCTQTGAYEIDGGFGAGDNQGPVDAYTYISANAFTFLYE